MKHDNLNRIRGILSAKKGAEVPKFSNSGKFTDPSFIRWCKQNNLDPSEETWIRFQKQGSNAGQSSSASGQNPILVQLVNESTTDIVQRLTPQTDVENAEEVMQRTKEKVTDATAEANTASVVAAQQPINTTTNITATTTTVPGATDTEGNPNAAADAAVAETVAVEKEKISKRAAIQARREELAQKGIAWQKAKVNTDTGLTVRQQARVDRISKKNPTRANKVSGRLRDRNTMTVEEMEIAGDIMSGAITGIGDAFGAQQQATDSELNKNVTAAWDATSSTLSSMGGVAGMVGQVMGIAKATGDIVQGITGGTDQISKTDQWMASPLLSWNVGIINDIWGEKSNAFGADQSILNQVGSSYGGTASDITKAASEADKKFGLFSEKDRLKANAASAAAAIKQNALGNIADTARDQRLAVQSMGEQAGLAYSMMTDGGYNQKYTYAAKYGGLLESHNDIESEWKPKIELNWELPTFKEGGSVEFVEELELIPEFKSGNKIRTIEELIEYAKQQNPRFIQRLSEEPRGIKFTDDEGNVVEGSHYLESRGEYVIPRIQEVNGELQFFNSQDARNKALETGNYLKLSPEEAIIFAEQYKQGWPDFFKKFKQGGSLGDSDIPEIEETTQKNVIPEGALHKNKHHMEHAEGLTKKGIPVVDEDGEQQAEIEHSEIIFTLEVTKKLEEYYEIFYSEDSTNKEKEQAALDAGKLLVYQILENTEDRTGLIESCKKGGTLNFKKDTEQLIEEVLEWMPTVVIVETEELEEKKEEKSNKKQAQDSKEELKQMIKQLLVEMLI